MKVKALVNCFVDNGYRREGEIFDCGSKFIPELMEPLEAVPQDEESAPEAPKLRKRGKAATEMSE
jgi:hypothetical protein